MLALVESESSFGAYVFHRRPAGLPAILALLLIVTVQRKLPPISVDCFFLFWKCFFFFSFFASFNLFRDAAVPDAWARMVSMVSKLKHLLKLVKLLWVKNIQGFTKHHLPCTARNQGKTIPFKNNNNRFVTIVTVLCRLVNKGANKSQKESTKASKFYSCHVLQWTPVPTTIL